MADPSNGDSKGGSARPPYAQFQVELYANAIIGGTKPRVTTDPNKLEEQARKAMSPEGFGYVSGGAGERATMHANRLAFRRWKLIPRFLRPTSPRDLSVKLFGHTYETPVLMAPVGVQSAYHQDAEPGIAAACADLGVPMIISTASSEPIETIAAAGDAAYAESPYSTTAHSAPGATSPRAPRWFQLYWPKTDELTASLLSRAKAAGCRVLVVTLDTFTLSWRPADLDLGFLPFAVGTGNANGFSDPVFQRMFRDAQLAAGDDDPQAVEESPILASRLWTDNVFGGVGQRWEDLALLRRLWGADSPMLLKGVMSVADAELAARHGMDGIIVSNHGGRQIDGAAASLDVLPEIVDAVGDRLTVLFDSGIRTGADIVKALALGAKAVLVGRPPIYGLGIAGKDGAAQVLAGLLADLDQTMGLAGLQNIGELNRSILRKANYAGDVVSNL